VNFTLSRLSQCLYVLERFQWLLDLYVLDFFVDDHWSRISPLWQEALRDMGPKELAGWLGGGRGDNSTNTKVLPLALMALKATVQVRFLLHFEYYSVKSRSPNTVFSIGLSSWTITCNW
jgi:hypothetical protein